MTLAAICLKGLWSRSDHFYNMNGNDNAKIISESVWDQVPNMSFVTSHDGSTAHTGLHASVFVGFHCLNAEDEEAFCQETYQKDLADVLAKTLTEHKLDAMCICGMEECHSGSPKVLPLATSTNCSARNDDDQN